MEFLEILPNNENIFDENLLDNIHKLSNNIENEYFELFYNLKNMFIENKHIILHKYDDPISYITSYFLNINANINTEQKYNIFSYDCSGDIIYLMFCDSLLNNKTYLTSLDTEHIENKFNLIASELIKYYNNNIAIFGNVFILGMNKSFYKKYDKQDNKEKINDICYKFNYENLIHSLINVNYIKILVKPNNNIITYNRTILLSFLENNNYELCDNNIIKCNHNNNLIYIKYSDPLPDSFNEVLKTSNTDVYNKHNYYLINLLDDEIKELIKI